MCGWTAVTFIKHRYCATRKRRLYWRAMAASWQAREGRRGFLMVARLTRGSCAPHLLASTPSVLIFCRHRVFICVGVLVATPQDQRWPEPAG